MSELIHFDKARQELELAATVDEVKNIRDKAEALRLYIRQQGESLEMQNRCAEIKIRAERKAGEMLAETEKNPGGRPSRNQSHHATSFSPKLSDIGITKSDSSRWQSIASIPERIFEEHVEQTKAAKQELTSAGALKLSKHLKQKAERQEVIDRIREEPQPLPEGPFRVIVIDPPWQYSSRSQDATHRARNPYPDMSLDEIATLPIPELAHDDCILWLWTTNAFIHDAFHLISGWGFQQKTILTWVKDKMGLGDWLRGQTEHCIMAVKGSPIVTLTNQTTALYGPLRDHSRKPDEFYKLCEGRFKIENAA